MLKLAAASFNISAKTAAKWVRRYREFGAAGLRDRSSRPHQLRTPISDELVHRVEALRPERWTGLRIARQTSLSRATVSRILRRLRLSRMRDPEPKLPVQRYEHAAAGDLRRLDIKKLGRIVRPSRRVTGDRRDSLNGAGWEYVHVAIDDHSRIAFSAICPDEKRASALAFLHAAAAYYARLGIRFKAVLTDNGPGLPLTRPGRGMQGAGPQATLHPALHTPHPRQGRTLSPDRSARMSLRPNVQQLKQAQPGASPLAAPVQLAPAPC